MQKKVTIIMGIYNCESTLGEAIESIIAQTYKQWKLIMCDDGSTDGTYEIAMEYANEYNNVFVYKNDKNEGLNYTLNCCLKYADTQYIARMDGDDVSCPDRLEREVQFLDHNPNYAIVSSSMIAFDENGDWGYYKNPEEPSARDFIKGSPFCHAPCMVRREAYMAVGGYTVDPKLLRLEDYHLWIKMYEKGFKGFNIDKPLYKMRDDRNATNRRQYKYRINEAYVRCLAIKMLNLPKIYCIFAARPLILGMLPSWCYELLHKKKVGIQNRQ